jgi:hypothetical protein
MCGGSVPPFIRHPLGERHELADDIQRDQSTRSMRELAGPT